MKLILAVVVSTVANIINSAVADDTGAVIGASSSITATSVSFGWRRARVYKSATAAAAAAAAVVVMVMMVMVV